MIWILFTLLVWASVSDIYCRKIPNKLIIFGMICGLLEPVFASKSDGMVDALLGMLLGLGIFIMPYAKGMLGAGDVKLMAMVGVFLGPSITLLAALYTLLAGGLVAALYAAYEGSFKHSVGNILKLKMGVSRVPYSIAILLGTFYAVYQHELN